MRPVNRGDRPIDGMGKPVNFKQYGDARNELINRLGCYCSFCEIRLPMALAVEHIQPKSLEPTLENEWSNFLLSCPSCNSIKGTKAINLHDYLWVNLDNTFRAFIYEKDRSPQIAGFLNAAQQQIAQNTLELTGLNREPSSPETVKDKRWKARKAAWDAALQAKVNLGQQPSEQMSQIILVLAIHTGFWSIWMTVFQNDTDMRQRLIDAFQGTSTDCFDGQTQALPRPNGQL